MSDRRCPCGSGLPFEDCCRARHDGTSPAGTAADLMRARYSAFVKGDAGYLHRSWHPSTRPARVSLDDSITWIRLEIIDTSAGGPLDDHGTVEFHAHHCDRFGLAGALRERSTFVRVDGEWHYLTGTIG